MITEFIFGCDTYVTCRVWNDACYRLGKTIQVIAFLSGMFDAEKIKSVMIVLPVAVIINWEREFKKWWVVTGQSGDICINIFNIILPLSPTLGMFPQSSLFSVSADFDNNSVSWPFSFHFFTACV